MICKKCGADIPEGANFCVKCGEVVEQSMEMQKTDEDANSPGNDVEVKHSNLELSFHKGTMLGRITFKKVDTRVEITEDGLQIEKKTKKIFRKEKTEERFIPFSQLASTSVHTVLDYWDTLYGVAFAMLGFTFNLWALLPAIVCFWWGYGKKVEFLTKSGEKYSFPYQFGKRESTILVEVCNKSLSKQAKTTDSGADETVNTYSYTPNGGNTSVQISSSKKFGKILKISVAFIFAISFLVVVFLINRPSKEDYIADVKSHKPFAESMDLDYTYGEILENYIADATWDYQETGDGAEVTIRGRAAGIDENIVFTMAVSSTPVSTIIDPMSVEIEDEKLSDKEEVASFLLELFQAYSEGYNDFADILGDEALSELERQNDSVDVVQKGYLGEYTDITVQDLLWGYYSTALYDDETWDSGTTDDGNEIVQVTYHDNDGDLEDVNIQFTMLSADVFKITAFVDPMTTIEKSTDLYEILNYMYFMQYVTAHQEILGDYDKEQTFIKQLETISASAVQYGAVAGYNGNRGELCTLTGDLPLDVNAAMLLDSAGLIDLNHYYSTPSPLPTQDPTPEPPAANDLSQYYGFYNSKDLGLFWVTLDKGSDDDSFYVYIEYEPMMKKSDVHADIKPDGEQHLTFYADGMTGSDGIIGDRNTVEGAVSLEILDDGALHMVLYTSKRKEDQPFDVILEPWERF